MCVCEKNRNDIINYFIQGRHKNCCVIYLSKSYYKTPKDIRINCSHYFIFESPTKRENEAICNEHRVDKEAYKRSFKNEYDCLYIDEPRKIAKRKFMGNYNIWDYSIIL